MGEETMMICACRSQEHISTGGAKDMVDIRLIMSDKSNKAAVEIDGQ